LLGAGGEAIIGLRAQGPGHTTIRLAYGHAWELEKATYLIKTLDVTVR
jgi:predicted secreted protein